MSKHTSGPWIVVHQLNVVGPNNRGVATTGGYANNQEQAESLHGESIANAKLIAAAPDLLEAAILVAEGTATSVGTTPLRMKMLRAAIAKATE